jgi:hypothetical protein
MEKFLVAGHFQSLGKKEVQLALPTAKHYAVNAVKNGEDVVNVKTLLEVASSRKKSEVYHIFPYISLPGYGQVPRTLQHILSKHTFPLSQGPVLLPNDCLTTEKYETEPIPKSVSQVLTSKTVFSHKVSQACYEWHPSSRGVSAWGKEGAGCEVRALSGVVDLTLAGPASVMSMSVVYTCMTSRCLVFCPCTICTDKRKTCKRLCKVEVCHDCSSQCLEHVIKLPRIFPQRLITTQL